MVTVLGAQTARPFCSLLAIHHCLTDLQSTSTARTISSHCRVARGGGMPHRVGGQSVPLVKPIKLFFYRRRLHPSPLGRFFGGVKITRHSPPPPPPAAEGGHSTLPSGRRAQRPGRGRGRRGVGGGALSRPPAGGRPVGEFGGENNTE